MIVACYYKENVSEILSDPPCNDENVRFTTVPLKPFYLISNVEEITVLKVLLLIFNGFYTILRKSQYLRK